MLRCLSTFGNKWNIFSFFVWSLIWCHASTFEPALVTAPHQESKYKHLITSDDVSATYCICFLCHKLSLLAPTRDNLCIFTTFFLFGFAVVFPEHWTFDVTQQVHSEWKNRSIFLTPQKWLFWHKLSSMDLRECILAIFGPPGPLGGVRGGRGGSGGVRGTKIFNFLWGHIWVPKCEILDCINWKHNFFQVFGQKQPLNRSKMAFLGSNGCTQKGFFSKTYSLNCLKMQCRRVFGSYMRWKKFGPDHPSKIFHDDKIRILARSDPPTGGKLRSHPCAIKKASNL